MICRQCLRRLAQQPRQISRTAITTTTTTTARNFSLSTRRTAAISAQSATASNPRPNDLPAATSTSTAQPFSAPLVLVARQSEDAPADSQPQRPKVVSSCVAGTPLKGLGFVKNKPEPLALEDDAYPEWLWSVLDKKSSGEDAVGEEGDMFSKSKKQRRIAAKALRKQQLLNPGLLEPKIPLYEQTIDLPAGDGTLQGAKEALAARAELTKAMRVQRRSKIKEANFLKEMR